MLTFVCGFGRCGSSLTMQMLDAAGLKCLGHYPAFEDAQWPPDSRRLAGYDVAKWLNPLQVPVSIGSIDCRAVWLDRDVKQQAKSARKFIEQVIRQPSSRKEERAFASAVRSDRSAALAYLKRITRGRVLKQRFEDLIAYPLASAAQLAEFVGAGDPAKMAAVAFERGPECLPGMLEEELIRHGKQKG